MSPIPHSDAQADNVCDFIRQYMPEIPLTPWQKAFIARYMRAELTGDWDFTGLATARRLRISRMHMAYGRTRRARRRR